MTVLVIGPSSCGKSTYLKFIGAKKIYYGYQLFKKEIPEKGYIHYNLLHYALTLQAQNGLIPNDFPANWELMQEPILKNIINSGKICKVIIIICRLEELKKRINNRLFTDKGFSVELYEKDLWSNILSEIDLNSLYLRLFALIQKKSIEVEYVLSEKKFIFKIIKCDHFIKNYLYMTN